MATNNPGFSEATKRFHARAPRSRQWLTRFVTLALVISTLPGLEMAREEANYHLLGRQSSVKDKVDRVKRDSRVMERLADDATYRLPLRYSQLPVSVSQLRQVSRGNAKAQGLVPPVVETAPNFKATNFSSILGRAAVVDAVTQTARDTAHHPLRGAALQADYRRHLAANVSHTAAEEETTIAADLAVMNNAIAHRGDGLPLMRMFSEFEADGFELGVIYDTKTGSYVPADWSGPAEVAEVTKLYPLTFDAAIQEQRQPGLQPIK